VFVDFHSAVTLGEGVSDGIILEETGNVFRGAVRLNCEEYSRVGVRIQWVGSARALLLLRVDAKRAGLFRGND
jgi:hypothetical protein